MKNKKSDHKANTRTYLRDYVLAFFYIPIAIWPLVYGEYISFTQIGLIFSIGFIIQAVLELPSGALADLIGRKKTIVISRFIKIFGFLMIVFANNFWMFFVAEVIDKIGEAFYSGSGVALIYDSLKENKKEGLFQKVESKGYFYATIGFVIASTLGGFLYIIDHKLPFIVVTFVWVAATINTLFFQEPKIDTEKANLRNYIKQNIQGFKHIFRHTRVKLVSFYSLAVSFVFLTGLWFLYQKAGNEMDLPVKYVGILISVMYICRAIGTRLLPKILKKVEELDFAILLASIQGIASFIVALPFIPLGILGLGTRYLTDGFRQPYLNKLQNEQIESKYRATSLSAVALLTSIALAIFTPLMGIGVDVVGARGVIAVTGFVSLLVAVPLGIALKKKA